MMKNVEIIINRLEEYWMKEAPLIPGVVRTNDYRNTVTMLATNWIKLNYSRR